MSRFSLGKERDSLIPASLAAMRVGQGQVSIPELAQQFAIGQRQLERLYRRQVGMSPRKYAQLIRVETARRALQNVSGESTTRLAADLGYYDQSHFIRDFSAVIGMTPYSYMKRSLKRRGSDVTEE